MSNIQKTPERLEWERQRELAASKSYPWAPEYPWTTETNVAKRVKSAWRRAMHDLPNDARLSLKQWATMSGNGYCMRWRRSKGMANA